MNVFTIGSMSNSHSFYKHRTQRATKTVTEMFVLVENSQINFSVVLWGQDQPKPEGDGEEVGKEVFSISKFCLGVTSHFCYEGK